MAPAGGLVSEATTSWYVHVPRQHKCSKFTGKMSVDLLTVEQVVEEVWRCLEARHKSNDVQSLFITDHLEGGPKSEVHFHANRDTPEKIFAILNENFSCAQSYVAAQLQLFQCHQWEGESLHDYSHALKSLMDIAIHKSPGGIPNSDLLLHDNLLKMCVTTCYTGS